MSKKTCLLIPLLLLSAGCAAADHTWTKENRSLQAARLAVLGVDWAQTRDIAAHPEKFTEQNYFLGGHPSEGQVDAYFAALALLDTGIAMAIPSEVVFKGVELHPRRYWQLWWTVINLSVVYDNWRMGVGLKF